jgi:hypothetical protein
MKMKEIIYSAPKWEFKGESYFWKARRRKKPFMVFMEVNFVS